MLSLAPSVTRLDISYTSVKTLDSIQAALADSETAAFEKLVLSGLQFRLQTGLQKFFKAYSQIAEDRRKALKVLKLGTLGIIDSVLAQIVPYLARLEKLEKVSLFSNHTLASGTGSGMARFLESVGRKCRVLDLSHIPLQSRQLAQGLLDGDEDSPLEVLILNNTAVNNDAALAIGMLRNLEELYLEQSRIDGGSLSFDNCIRLTMWRTVEGMTMIMQGCPNLRVVNLTGCRGIPTRQRRDWFELYERGEVGEED